MRRLGRTTAMVTAAVAMLGLGFVVAVAAGSLSTGSEDRLLETDFRLDLDLSPVLAWILLLLAVAGAVLFALGMREARPRREGGGRSYLAILIGIIVFVAVFRWARPAVESLLGDAGSATEAADEVLPDGVGPGSAWLFSVLLAAVVAAALTRVGLSIRAGDLPFQPEPEGEAPGEVRVTKAATQSRSLPLGSDPRSRVLAAYHRFESALSEAGGPRPANETTGRHARRVGEALGLDRGDIEMLVVTHAIARYDSAAPGEEDAIAAERSSASLRERLGQ